MFVFVDVVNVVKGVVVALVFGKQISGDNDNDSVDEEKEMKMGL